MRGSELRFTPRPVYSNSCFTKFSAYIGTDPKV